MELLVFILICGTVAALWVDSLRTREQAIRFCIASCKEHGVQFLDQTIALTKLGIRWLPEGIRLRRIYRFEYSEDGTDRRDGHIIMRGLRLEEISMGLPSTD